MDNKSGWCVRQDLEIEISERQLFKDFLGLGAEHAAYYVPHPSQILDVRTKENPGVQSPWSLTDPVDGNRWRKLVKGKRVMSLPLWMYCDDTSGNVSKKWNEHNSFLFTLAGLSREQSSKEYNVHFLCTSNLAPPLEMMDGVVAQLELAQDQGIWAWDCHLKEMVLIFPAILALLGDNPMQSSDAQAEAASAPQGPQDSGAESMEDSGDDIASDISNADSIPQSTAKARRRTVKESMGVMVKRIRSFLRVGHLRNHAESEAKLKSYFTLASEVGNKTALKKAKTESGIKDTIQEHFTDKLFAAYKGKFGNQRQESVDAALKLLPDKIVSPVWRIKGLDPHQDMPVEILHVVLLGFIKYFWRDLIQNDLKGKDSLKELLIQRLSSFNVSGLGISSLNGKTLVQYAGSLTGRDFRHIAQAAPFVIYDMVTSEKLAAWVSLSKLVPLVWQPVIQDLNSHVQLLKHEINVFLLRTAQWATRWFNKPKFHLLLHLPAHIRCFGPAILFATEAFESFNAVIRAKSVHSNRQAPSQDIGKAFAQGNRIRHLLSGGFFVPRHLEDDAVEWPSQNSWCQAGPAVRRLLLGDNIAMSYLGIPSLEASCESKKGRCTGPGPKVLYPQTLTGLKLPHLLRPPQTPPLPQFKTAADVVLLNGDKCVVGQHVVIQPTASIAPSIAIVREIVQQVGSKCELQGEPDGILLQTAQVVGTSEKLEVPHLLAIDHWTFAPLQNILCTINTQHDCECHNCGATGMRYVYQERAPTANQVAVIQHRQQPQDRLLNLNQMRDAIHL
ncbi:hypothetical protein CPB84DRAFT_1749908 [Gymnopilus junonius]|uniref:Uncharacterized protein n=1 Tax=Gymnopilus junonius TaxID=109634 RepID=A0A9P5NI94_GYMJU|nr:hypothetical protein CPB84DRAFT_1749908 [Gymnopilus junonius]